MSQNDLIVYRARGLSKVVAREVERLRKELGLTVHVVSYTIDGDAGVQVSTSPTASRRCPSSLTRDTSTASTGTP